MTLPAEAARLVEQVMSAARLSPRQADRVRCDLEAHFHDGLERRIPVGELIASFGEPGTVASLIRHTTKRNRCRSLSRNGLAAGIAVIAAYGIAFVRVASFPVGGPPAELDAELASVAATIAGAEHSLRNRSEVEASFEIARDLTVAGSLWKRVAGVVLLEKTLRAGDSVLTAAAQQRLLALVKEELQSPVADGEAVADAQRALARRLGGNQGRMDQDRLRLLRLAKGFGHRAFTARLLEPIYFSRAIDPAELRAIAAQLVLQRVAAAEEARRTLLRRLASPYAVAT